MLDRTCLVDERTTRYATVADFSGIFTEEMHSLYLLSFMLTADNHKAEQCFVSGMVACEQEIDAFMEWARLYARPAILKHAIRMVMPAPEHTDNFSYLSLKEATPGKNSLLAAIVALNAFERFVFVMSVLEGQSDDECSTLLRCSRRDVMIARELTLKRLRLANYRQHR
jgi:DNA-directed RNA polymerase specialized sigma24 family protein